MLNLPLFLALAGERLAATPLALYFHENQLTYPLRPGEKRDLHFGFINFVSALRADAVFFNSAYHLEAFFDELPRLLKHFPDYNELWAVEALRAKASVLSLGLDLRRFDESRPLERDRDQPAILWNHRWEYDKDPETFFEALYELDADAFAFDLILLGESFRNQPSEFLEARRRLSERIVHFGYADDTAAYARLLWAADIVVSTALHEFFGASVVEACYCDCFPILPRRLSYPELIPEAYHDVCLYDGSAGLRRRLRQAISQAAVRRTQGLRDRMACYDWQQMAPRYDDILERVVAAGRKGIAP
jgi:glycosyltransferase involved in cell wall biosynthesis